MGTNNDNDTKRLLQEAVIEIKKYVDDSLRTNFEDFKQYTDATVSRQTSELRSDIQEIRGDINRLDQKIDDLSDAVAEAIDTSNDETQNQLDNHENRILKLEQNAT